MSDRADSGGRSGLWPFLVRWRWQLTIAVISYPIVSGLGLLPPLVIKAAVDTCLVPRQLEGLDWLIAALVGINLLELALRYVQVWLSERVAQRMGRELRIACFAKLLRLAQPEVDRRASGAVVSQLVTDVDAVVDIVSSGVLGLAGDILLIGGILVAMILVDAELAAYAMLSFPPLAIGVALTVKRNREKTGEVRAEEERLGGALSERIAGAPLIRVYGRGPAVVGDLDRMDETLVRTRVQAIQMTVLTTSLVDSAAVLATAAMLFAAAWTTLEPAGIGAFVAIIEYLRRLFAPVADLANRWSTLQTGLVAWERVSELLRAPQQRALDGATVAIGPVEEAIRFQDVDFAYPGGAPVLDQISLGVRRGERVAIVGPTGGGKSTIAKLVAGSLAPTRGQVTVDGVDLQVIDPRSWHRRLTVVLQDVVLFAGSIRDNVAFGLDLSAPDGQSRLDEAARRARASGLIARAADGWHTEVGEFGNRLSSGERQLIAIARAFLRDPEILLLDEATSAIDPETEAMIHDALAELIQGRTALLIAHRLSTIQSADRIVFVSGGQIREQGTHEELMAMGRLYRQQIEYQTAANRPSIDRS